MGSNSRTLGLCRNLAEEKTLSKMGDPFTSSSSFIATKVARFG